MNKHQFKQALELAELGDSDISNIDLFYGFGLKDFKTVNCLTKDIAGLINWQARQLNGLLDSESVSEIYKFKHKFNIMD